MNPSLMILLLTGLWLGSMARAASPPFRSITDAALPMAVTRTGLYDLQPSILYDQDDPNPKARFKMWWLGQDPNSPTGTPSDRIYFATSADGSVWSVPTIVLAPQLGASGQDAADDHLLGSPSVLKLNGRFYMFYEAYGTYATVVNRFYSFARGDNWTTHGFPQETGDWLEGYASSRLIHGFAPRFRKAGTHPVYAGEITYTLPGGPKKNRFLRRFPVGSGTGMTPLNQGAPVFWLYSESGPGRTPLYSFWASQHANTFTSTDPAAEGVPGAMPDWSISPEGRTHILGYISSSLDTPDMLGCLQNRIMLATSEDGVQWTRFAGPARGGAILSPVDALASHRGFSGEFRCPNEVWDIHRSYGSGYPAALARDGFVEVYFTDDTIEPGWLNRCEGLNQVRVRIPLAGIDDPKAYASVAGAWETRDAAGFGTFYGQDIKWSPRFRRYFLTTFSPEGEPLLVWSELDPDPAFPPVFPRDPSQGYAVRPENIHAVPSDGNRRAGPGGIAGTGLGQTLDFAAGASAHSPYTAVHVFYESVPAHQVDSFSKDIGHSLAFFWDHEIVPLSVRAGDDIRIQGSGPARTTLHGSLNSDSASDAGNPALSIRWEQISGPGRAQLEHPDRWMTGVVLPVAGDYVFRLTASNGHSSASDEVTVGLSSNTAPTAQAGPDQTARWTGAPMELVLRGRAVDDGLPAVPGRLDVQWSKRLGPGVVSFSDSRAAATSVRFTAPGEYVLRLTVGDGALTDTDEVTIRLTVNEAPRVSAGPIPSVQSNSRITLQGTATDDGLPSNRLTTTWSRVAGPAIVFDDPANTRTGAKLSSAGRYLLRLTASDGERTSADELTIDWSPNQPPTVNAGQDQRLSGNGRITLRGSVLDDGLPKPSRLTMQWTRVSGPAATLAQPNAAQTGVTLSTTGTYVFRLTAYDGSVSASDEVRVDFSANEAPRVRAGNDVAFTLAAGTISEWILTGSVRDDTLPSSALTVRWDVVSGPGQVRFGQPHSPRTTVWVSRVGTYVLRLTASDGTLSSSDTLRFTLAPSPGSNIIEGTVTSYGGNRYQIAGGAQIDAIVEGIVVGTTTANAAGKYRFPGLGAGSYSVRATWKGYSGTLANCALFLPARPPGRASGCNVSVR